MDIKTQTKEEIMTTDQQNENTNPESAIIDERTGEVIPKGAPAPIAKAMYTFDA